MKVGGCRAHRERAAAKREQVVGGGMLAVGKQVMQLAYLGARWIVWERAEAVELSTRTGAGRLELAMAETAGGE